MKRTATLLLLFSFILVFGWRLHLKLTQVAPDTIADLQRRGGTPVTLVSPERADLVDRFEFHGSLEARRDVKIFAEVPGLLVECAFDDGDRVSEGRLLARIDDREFKAQYLMADADLKIAEAALAKARKGAREQEVAAALAAVDGARANAERAETDLARLRGLVEARSVSAAQLSTAEKAAEAARAALAAAEAQYSAVREGTRSEDLAAAEAGFQAAQGRFALAKLTFEKTRILAPFAGVVTERNFMQGDFVLPATNPMGKPLCRLLDLAECRFVGRLSERHIGRLAVGSPVAVRVPAAGFEATGPVLLVDPAGDALNRDFMVKISLDNAGGRLLPGMFAVASLTLAECRGALALPVDVVRERRGDRGIVYVVEGDVARRREVTLGVEAGERVEIRAGLDASDRVAAAGAEALVDGAPVRLPEGM